MQITGTLKFIAIFRKARRVNIQKNLISHGISVGRTYRTRYVKRASSRHKESIKIKIQISAENINWIQLINVDFRAFVKTVMKLKFL